MGSWISIFYWNGQPQQSSIVDFASETLPDILIESPGDIRMPNKKRICGTECVPMFDQDDCKKRKCDANHISHQDSYQRGSSLGIGVVTNVHINSLPDSIVIQIFGHLSMQDIVKRAALVCKHWHQLCFDSDLWHHVCIKGQLKVDDAILNRITSYSKNLMTLDLTDVRVITNECVQNTLKHCTQLQTLILNRCMHLTDETLGLIGDNCRKLRQLKLECCSAITDKALTKIGAGCARLEKLWLAQCSRVSDEGIMAVARGCPRLKLLNAEQCRQITDTCMEALTSGCPQLEQVALMGNSMSYQGLKHLTKCSQLRVLEMTQIEHVTDDVIVHLVHHCLQLHTLNLSLCTHVSDKSVHYIAQHGVRMRDLYLVACKVTDQALVSLAKHSKTLEKLDVGWCTQITDEGAEAISRGCENLHYLGLMRCDLVTKDASDRLVKAYPGITYSTMWLECERLLARARDAGYSIA